MLKNKTTVLVFIIAFCAVFIAIAHFQFFSARQITIDLYGQRQVVLAKQVSLSVENFFKERLRALELIAEKRVVQQVKTDELLEEFRHIYNKIDSFEHILFINPDGQILVKFPDRDVPFLNERMEHINSIIKQYSNKELHGNGLICDHHLLSVGQNLICTRIPVFNEAGELVGVIVGAIDLNKSLDAIIKPVLADDNVHPFILSQRGELIYHPLHTEMVQNNIFTPNKACVTCHQDFATEEKMTLLESGWEVKECADEEDKLLSFARIELPGVAWSLAIDMPYDVITKVNSRQFWMFFILSFMMIAVVIVGSIGIFRINKARLEVEKESQFFKKSARLLENVQEAEAKYRSLVEQSPDAIALIQNDKFVFVNEKFLSLFGYSLQELNLKNRSLYDLVTEDSMLTLREEMRAFINSDADRLKIMTNGKTKSDEILDLEITVGKLLLDGKLAHQLVIHDVTEMKMREREASRREHLAFIGEMSARIAHEIKNPLASLQAGIQLVESNLPGDKETKEYFQRLTGEVHRVDRIVKGLLSYAREEQISRKKTVMFDLVNRVVELNKQAINGKEIKWTITNKGNGGTAMVDPQKIEQVMWNLIGNALQSIPKSGEINIILSETEPEIFRIIVSDTGEGISPDNLEKMFQPFFSTKAQGTGLGLAISKKIILAHGGLINVESEKLVGTQVTIDLPRNANG